jgi:hypothetical protein
MLLLIATDDLFQRHHEKIPNAIRELEKEFHHSITVSDQIDERGEVCEGCEAIGSG